MPSKRQPKKVRRNQEKIFKKANAKVRKMIAGAAETVFKIDHMVKHLGGDEKSEAQELARKEKDPKYMVAERREVTGPLKDIIVELRTLQDDFTQTVTDIRTDKVPYDEGIMNIALLQIEFGNTVNKLVALTQKDVKPTTADTELPDELVGEDIVGEENE